MNCKNCGSDNITIQVVNESHLKNQHHSIIWWLLVGWWWLLIKWMIFTIPALIIKLLGHKKKKIVNKQVKMAVCQSCSATWKI